MNSNKKLKQHIAEKYWLDKLKNTNTSESKTFCTTSKIVVSNEKLRFFKKLTSNNEVAEFTVLFGLFSAMIQRYFIDYDLIFSENNLQYRDVKRNVPLFYKIQETSDCTLKEYFGKCKQEVLEVYKYAEYDHKTIENKLGKDIRVSSQYGLIYNSKELASYDFPFLLQVTNHSDEIFVNIFFSEDFIDKELANHFLNTYKSWLENIEQNLTTVISEIPIITQKEKTKLLGTFNNHSFNFPKEKTIVDLFEKQVKDSSNKISVYTDHGKLSYQELNTKVNKLANYLRNKEGIGSGDIIGVLQPKSENALVTILAILKTGAAFLPIDIKHPTDRINYIINDSQLRLIITTGLIKKTLDAKSIDLDTLELNESSAENLGVKIKPDDIAYVIYTSGSTGKPKGVPIAHTSNINMSLQQVQTFEVTSEDVVIWFASISFDATVSEIMMAFYSGACLSIPEEEDIIDTHKLVTFLKESKTTIATFPPSYLDLIDNKDLLQMKSIITAGEAAHPKKAYEIAAEGIQYYNAYGPTECAVCVSMYSTSVKDQEQSFIPIGKPLANLSVYVLDQNLQLVPVGVPGVLYVSGIGVANGYLNKPTLSQEKFIPNPFLENTKMYNTGDLVSWLPDGNLQYIGREDTQVKIRGHRIELGEIENTISKAFENIKQVAVTVKQVDKDKALVAYSTLEVDTKTIKNYLEQHLPSYMVPTYFVAIAQLPLTINGKVNYKELPDITISDIDRGEYIAPSTELQKEMVSLWEELIGVQNIGIRDNFFALGGHSLKATQLLNTVRSDFGYQLKLKDFFANPTIEGVVNVMTKIEQVTIPKVTDQTDFPLTPSQKRLWVLSQFEGGNAAYNIPIIVKLKGALNIDYLQASFDKIIERHEVLRTAFVEASDQKTLQKVTTKDHISFQLEYTDYSLVDNQEDYIHTEIKNIYAYEFNLANGNLISAKIIKLTDQEHVLIFCIHHIIGDGWSMQLLISELAILYNAQINKEEPILPELTIQYKDYAVWLTKELQKGGFEEQSNYWTEKLNGELPVLQLPSYCSRPKDKTYNGASIDVTFSKEFSSLIEEFKTKKETTLFTVLMAGINGLFYRYTEHQDIILGTIVAGRGHQDIENQIGLYLNTLAIRTQFEEAKNFGELVATQKQTLKEAFTHQEYPFDLLIDELNIPRNPSRSPLFDVMVVLQNQQDIIDTSRVAFDNLQIDPYSNTNTTSSKFDLTFSFTEENEKIALNLEYNTDIYDASIVDSLIAHLEHFITEAIKNEEKPLDEIDFLNDDEKKNITQDFNNTAVPYPSDKTIVTLFNDQVIKSPDHIALVYKETKLSYRELDNASTSLAIYLLEHYQLQKEDSIGISLSQSEYLIIGILATLKTGCAYVPIDSGFPKERKKYMQEDSNCILVIEDNFISNYLDKKTTINNKLPSIHLTPKDAAYIIYTSGSTGNPKGVIIEQQSVVRLVKPCSYFPLSSTNTLLSTGSISFDATIIEYFGTLLNGATLVLSDKEDLLDTKLLETIIKNQKVDSLWMTASWFKQVVENRISVFDTVQQLIVGGDVVSPFHTSKLLQKNPSLKIVNGYGPTENTTFSVTFPIEDKQYMSIPIGKPIDNSTAYILNGKQKLVPVGVVGELYLAGDGLAREYLNQPELTKKTFLKNPFAKGERMYKTGDLARWLPDGNIEFLGRKDTQVKIRGYRIEIGEVEHALLQHEKISQVFVKVEIVNNVKSIIAYIITATALDKQELRYFLLDFLPEYMIPSYYIFLENLPLTRNGKTDTKALPKVTGQHSIQKVYEAPTNAIETKIAVIWQKNLGIEQVGIADNFFEIGGNSLQAIKILNEIKNEFNIEVVVRDFFQYQNIKELAQLISFKTHNTNIQDQKTETEYEEITL